MNIAFLISFGVLAGVIANLTTPKLARDGLLGAILLGTLGSILGATIANIVINTTRTSLPNVGLSITLVAILGTLGLLAAQRLVRKL